MRTILHISTYYFVKHTETVVWVGHPFLSLFAVVWARPLNRRGQHDNLRMDG